MIELEVCTQSWVNREHWRGMSTHPCGAPVLKVSEVEMLSNLHHLGAGRQKVQDPIAQGGVEAQGLQLDDELGGYYGVEC